MVLSRSKAPALERFHRGSASSYKSRQSLYKIISRFYLETRNKGSFLVPRLQPWNAFIEALPPATNRGRASIKSFPGRTWKRGTRHRLIIPNPKSQTTPSTASSNKIFCDHKERKESQFPNRPLIKISLFSLPFTKIAAVNNPTKQT